MNNSPLIHLTELLRRYQPSQSEENAYRTRMLELARSPQNSLCRSEFKPGHFTASSFVLSPDKQQILLIFHKKLQRWLQPGGHVEPTDFSILDAARREVREEVGISNLSLLGDTHSIFDIDIHEIPAHKTEAAHSHFDIRFAFCARNTEFQTSSEVVAGKWFYLSEIATIESDESVSRAVRKLL